MRRGAKPKKTRVAPKPTHTGTSPTDAASRVRDLERRLAEALDQQTASAEILRIISSSPTDVQPVLDEVLKKAVRVCQADLGLLFRYENDAYRLAASQGARPEFLAFFDRGAITPSPDTGLGRIITTRRAVQIDDVTAEDLYRRGDPLRHATADLEGIRTWLGVPMIKDGDLIGAIVIYRREVRPFADSQVRTLLTFADQAVIAIDNARLFNETKEALEEQKAMAEILAVISSSPTDTGPVFETIAESAVRLCGSVFSAVFTFTDGLMRLVAHRNFSPDAVKAMEDLYPARPGHETASGRAILNRTVIEITDVLADPQYGGELQSSGGWRSTFAVPMLRGGKPIGAIAVGWAKPGPAPPRSIILLQTFADQAVIAIENVRLFTELQEKNRALTESLEQQTATADILQVISRSPTEVGPVFEAVVTSAARLCEAHDVAMLLVDGNDLRLVAGVGPLYISIPPDFRIRLTRGSAATRAVVDRAIVHIHDFAAESEEEYPVGRELARRFGHRSMLAVPLLREGVPIGVVCAFRLEVRPFPDQQIALLRTFADQAVIAIENVRLFKELEEKNQSLTAAHARVTESLEQQTATSEILRVISSSPTDVQPVFATIAENAVRLCHGLFGGVLRLDGEALHLAGEYNLTVEGLETWQRIYPAPLSRYGMVGRAILDRSVTHVPDIEKDPEEMPADIRAAHRRAGFRSILAVPMLRDGTPLGGIFVARRAPEPFTRQQIDLLQTFADQAVIAIENVRLFTELQTSNRELTSALDTQIATSDILRVISRSQTDVQPVFDAIVRSAVRLLEGHSGLLTRVVGDQRELGAFMSTDPAAAGVLSATYPRRVNSPGAHGQAIRDRVPVNILDTHIDLRITEAGREDAHVGGYRSMVVVPLLRQDEAIGALAVTRREPGGFTDDEIALLQTFADQAVIAIENARLLTELRARTQALTRSVEQLTALGEVGRAVSSTLDLETVLTTIVSRAVQLSGLDGGVVFEYDEAAEEFVHRAATESGGGLAEARRAMRIRKGEGVVGRTAITLEPAQVPDITVPGVYVSRLRDNLIESGIRAILAVPMMRDDRLIGCLVVSRNRSGDFPAETIELLRTFATQSALAIQNARLFREIADKSRQLEAASRHKSEFLANMSHELRTPLNAIIGFSEVLTERMFGELNEKQEEYLKDIHASGQHLLSLINDILDLSKIEAGRMDLELKSFDLPQAIGNAVTLVRERAARRGIALHQAVDQRLGQIRGDERKVKQVLLNLLSNALKFTPEGGRVDVRASLVNNMAEIAVADTGVGIASEDQEAVFEEFRQVGTADKKVEGTGLGLALSRKFIELHGGRIWVQSQPGQGSTFTFRLPLSREP